MNNQVLSIEQCKELIELGIDMSNASMCYFIGAIEELFPIYGPVEYSEHEYIPTFTLQDILILLEPYHRLMVIRREPDEWVDSAFELLKFQYKDRNN